ncbi:uncharacterized protein AB9W97_020251 isoform 2-T2 [Spinachia spinachia]
MNANLPGSGGGGAPGQRFAPTDIHNIPEYLGGSAIRRLSGRKMMPPYVPSHQAPLPVLVKPLPYKAPPPAIAKPPPYLAPPPPSSVGSKRAPAPPKPSVSTETRWMRLRSDQLL